MNVIRKNQKGVALLIVIAVVGMLASLMVDFLFETNIQHEMVMQEKKRLQAYYLAQSSLNFSKLLLLYDKKLQSQMSKMGADSKMKSSMGMQPLYKMFPLSSSLLRGMIGGSSDAGADEDTDTPKPEGDAAADEAGGGDDAKIGELTDVKKIDMFKSKEAQEFLQFDGDFESEISEEQSKYALNAISKIAPNSPSYDMQKKILLAILMQPQFKHFFQNQETDAATLTHAIADYIDANDLTNEFDNVERGQESTLYKDVDYPPKNARMLTLSELRMVPGMNDNIYQALEPFVTVYQSSDKVNVCLADESLVNALIVDYTTYAECTTPVLADDKDKLKELREAMLLECPDTAGVANALNVALGLKEDTAGADQMTDGSTDESTDESGSTKKKTTSTVSTVEGCKIQFESLISSTNTILRIKATGTVDDVHTTINTVLDTSANDTKSWKVLYFQVQ
jgi:type II secretory pathway component PulK